MTDPHRLRAHADDYTADLLDQATGRLAWLRGLDDTDPTARLHLLASIRDQLHAEILHTTLRARDHGHDPLDIAVILNLPG